MERRLLALDLSNKCSGWALFDLDTKKLIKCGFISSSEKGISTLKYPKNALEKCIRMSADVQKLITELAPEQLVIEEVNRGISRIGQKSLDALHFFVLFELRKSFPNLLDSLAYLDSNGTTGWRTVLKMKLSDADKKHNLQARKNNKKSKVKQPVINWKHLAARFVNDRYDLGLDVDERESDGDVADAICVGVVYLLKN
jgi:hypothetical protein